MAKKNHIPESPVYIPMASMSPEYTCIYFKADYKGSRSFRKPVSYRLPFSTKTEGLISKKAERRIKKAISWMLEVTEEKTYFSERHGMNFKFKVNFVTLTLPSKQVHSDAVIKKECLNQFLVECRKYHKVTNYIWRAEAQKNGNIHFHICFDQYIHHSNIRKMWNRIVEKLGYVSRYSEEMREFHKDGFQVRKDLLKWWSKSKQYQAFMAGMSSNWENPNSTDVHAIKKINNLSAYLAKYCTKNDPVRVIEGKLWGLSQGLSSCKNLSIELIGQEADEMAVIQPVMEHKVRRTDYATIIYEKASVINSWFKGKISQLWSDHVQSLRDSFQLKKVNALKLAG